MFYKYFLSVNDESYDTILAGKCQFAHANTERTGDTLVFPEPKVLYLYSEKEIPQYLTLHLIFGKQGSFDYQISTLNFIKTPTEELNQKKLILLIPFQLLKLRHLLTKDRSPQNLDRLKKLILNDILKPIEDNCESGNIEASDAVSLKELTLKLYDHLYAHYCEMINGGVNSMVNDVLELDSDKIIARIRAEFADELEQTKEQLEEAREETAKTKEIIRRLRAGKEIAEVAEELQISTDKVNEIADLLK